jgi:hypothetical protein
MTRTTDFLHAEHGAVTVDWVVLTAATVGLGMATMGALAGGVRSLTAAIDETLRGDIVDTAFAVLAEMDFSDGMDGWSGGEIRAVPGMDQRVLVLSRDHQTTSRAFAVPTDGGPVTVEFDMALFDSWDGEFAAVLVNDERVALTTHNFRDGTAPTVQDLSDSGMTVEVVSSSVGATAFWQGAGNHEAGDGALLYNQRIRVTVEDTSKMDALMLGFETNLQQVADDEGLGIDNVTVSG